MNIEIKKLHDDASIPSRNTSADAGYDLYTIGHDVIKSGEIKLVNIGMCVLSRLYLYLNMLKC